MQLFKIAISLMMLNMLGGCGVLQGTKLLVPEHFDLIQITPSLYVEPATDSETREKLSEAMDRAKERIRVVYGHVNSQPIVHACITEECYEAFGGRGSMAKVYGNRILLSPRALNWNLLAHEWSHAELRTRLSFRAWLNTPQWFDEGVAVAVSEAPEHSESHWQFLVNSNIPRPTPEELHTYQSLSQWLDAVHRYGEDKNIDRKASGEAEIRPVYTAAGHEVRPWLATKGQSGLLSLIERLNEGESFETAYSRGN
jgi:hypothetical protein